MPTFMLHDLLRLLYLIRWQPVLTAASDNACGRNWRVTQTHVLQAAVLWPYAGVPVGCWRLSLPCCACQLRLCAALLRTGADSPVWQTSRNVTDAQHLSTHALAKTLNLRPASCPATGGTLLQHDLAPMPVVQA
jgi:hypothetical protein